MNRDNYAQELLTYTGTRLKEFRAKDLDTGLFWDEQDEKKDFRFEESATRDLIRGLEEVHEDFQKESGLDKHVSLKLISDNSLHLLKYLEERDEKSASGYFAGTLINIFIAQTFLTLLHTRLQSDLIG
ncbi:MAG: hypothetical protein U5R06_12555 [candidate division KSB1 bacterium]|nr:hypothetical protein [candidate division KSB1 bacterium]